VRFCHGANVAEEVPRVNEGSVRCAITVTSSSAAAGAKTYLPSRDFAENGYEYETRDIALALCWLALRALCYKFLTGFGPTTRAFHQFSCREINCKLVYYGPGLGGKTANLQWIYDHTGQNQKGKMVSLATETDRTLFF